MISVTTRQGAIFTITVPSNFDVQVECKNINVIMSYFHFSPSEARELAAALVVCAEQIELSKK